MLKRTLIRTISLLIVLALCLSMSSCRNDEKEAEQDTSDLTMYIGLGNTNSTYYKKLCEAILENTGVDVKCVYNNTNDTTNAIFSRIKNNDLPADIVITAQRAEDSYQQNAFLDLAKYTNIPDLFKSSVISDLSVDGGVYQLPFTTRLIGIEYNKTLLDEMGWKLPHTFDEMVELKKQVEAAGYPFAVTAGVATGHGFNYLFYVMGTQYLASPDGTEWLTNFQNGTEDASDFADACEYFEKYVEAGLFGSFHDSNWAAAKEACQTRALFYYNLTNDNYSYDGFRYNAAGEVIGDTELHDEYASIPWISENGNSNCYVRYDSMFVALDKKLSDDSEKSKLEKAVKVLEFMASDTAVKLFTDMFPDGYVSTSSFNIDESRLYYDSKEAVEKGFIIPWYYNYFDSDTIVNVGDIVNKYIKGSDGYNLDTIISELEKQNSLTLAGKPDKALEITADYSYEECARLQAGANAISLQNKLDENWESMLNSSEDTEIDGEKPTIDVSIMPYTDDIKKLPLQTKIGVVQEKLYEGTYTISEIKRIVQSVSQKPVAIYMTGTEIKELVSNGFDITEDYGEAIAKTDFYNGYEEAVFPYVMLVRNNVELKDDESYYVAIPSQSMKQSVYEQYLNENKVILNNEGKSINGDTEEGLKYLFDNYEKIGPNDVIW